MAQTNAQKTAAIAKYQAVQRSLYSDGTAVTKYVTWLDSFQKKVA